MWHDRENFQVWRINPESYANHDEGHLSWTLKMTGIAYNLPFHFFEFPLHHPPDVVVDPRLQPAIDHDRLVGSFFLVRDVKGWTV